MAMRQMPGDIPSNSDKDRQKRVEQVVTTPVATRNQPVGKKLADTFINGDLDSVKSYLIFEVLIPSIKETIAELVNRGINMLLFDDYRSSSKKNSQTVVSYRNYSTNSTQRYPDRPTSRKVRDYQDIIFKNVDEDGNHVNARGAAEEVLTSLINLIEDYGNATIADLYDLVGRTGEFTDHKYGWKNLASAGVERVRDGYRLDLPRPIFIE